MATDARHALGAAAAAGASRLGGGLSRAGRRLAGLGLLAAAATVAAALLGHAPGDPSFFQSTTAAIRNPLGPTGASLSAFLLQFFGGAAWLLPAALGSWGARLTAQRPLHWPWLPLLALPVAMMALAALLAQLGGAEGQAAGRGSAGGLVGLLLWDRLEAQLGGGALVWLALGAAGLATVLALGLRWRSSLRAAGQVGAVSLVAGRGVGRAAAAAGALSGRLVAAGRRTLAADEDDGGASGRRGLMEAPAHSALAGLGPRATVPRRRPAPRLERPEEDDLGDGDDADVPPWLGRAGSQPDAGDPIAPPREPKRRGRSGLAGIWPPAPANTAPDEDFEPPEMPKPAKARGAPVSPRPSLIDSDFVLPPLDLLAPVRHTGQAGFSPQALHETSRQLETVLDDFGVRGQINDAKPGPVVTLYELEPAPGTRAARVVSLADDIARSLCALSVRVATVPGRNVIGVELPNEQRETVFLRDLLEADPYRGSAARLPLTLGKDISGKPIVVDLARMPHLLIAGTTGSGKSVAINAMILSLLYRLTPDELRLIMIDPKVIELSVYEDIPHLLAPVVTEPHKAVVALKWVVRQMDERYRLMSHLGVRDIFAFNRRILKSQADGEELKRRVRTGFEPGTGVPIFEDQPIESKPMPLIVVIVDEVADLMLTAGKEIENAIQRLSQKARAAGIHLIVATQRPSVDVLTGVIKANLPSRISFRVSSKIDSRTILGEPGAEQLLGQGDMLHLMPGDRIARIHGPLVTDQEVDRVASHWKAQGEPDYVEDVTHEDVDEPAADGPLFEAGSADNAYDQAVQIVMRDGKASTSYLQRKLAIGYNSAAKLIERMEADGVISTADHVGRRQVLRRQGGEDAGADY